MRLSCFYADGWRPLPTTILSLMIVGWFGCRKPAVSHQISVDAPVQTIAFGSCSDQNKPQVMWPHILAQSPDLWIWLGDNIYADTENMRRMARAYKRQKSNRQYQSLRRQARIIGIWDDHDYGINDGDKRFAAKHASKEHMLDFLDVPENADVRKRPGAYQSYDFGPANQRIKVILLDTRFFRDVLQQDPQSGQRYLPNPTGDILGEAQWEWLASELKNSQADIHIITSGIQILPDEHYYEKWSNFPRARQRFLQLLEEEKPKHLILLSGDRHIAEISHIALDSNAYPVYEVTSSGLTHSYEKADEANRYRISPLIVRKNFGVLRIDWSGDVPVVHCEIRGRSDTAFARKTLYGLQ